jgi:hypothetical protein
LIPLKICRAVNLISALVLIENLMCSIEFKL